MSKVKITLIYDQETGWLEDENGVNIQGVLGMVSVEPDKKTTGVQDLVQLKEAGFTADEIMEMHKKGVI